MDALAECRSDLALARERLIEQLREHALQVGEFTRPARSSKASPRILEL
jgi:hypothetical protein